MLPCHSTRLISYEVNELPSIGNWICKPIIGISVKELWMLKKQHTALYEQCCVIQTQANELLTEVLVSSRRKLFKHTRGVCKNQLERKTTFTLLEKGKETLIYCVYSFFFV